MSLLAETKRGVITSYEIQILILILILPDTDTDDDDNDDDDDDDGDDDDDDDDDDGDGSGSGGGDLYSCLGSLLDLELLMRKDTVPIFKSFLEMS